MAIFNSYVNLPEGILEMIGKSWVILGYTGEILGYTAIYWDIRVSR